jgi:hypothetical protein
MTPLYYITLFSYVLFHEYEVFFDFFLLLTNYTCEETLKCLILLRPYGTFDIQDIFCSTDIQSLSGLFPTEIPFIRSVVTNSKGVERIFSDRITHFYIKIRISFFLIEKHEDDRTKYRLSSRFPELTSRFPELTSRFPELISRFSDLTSRFFDITSRFSDLKS